MKFHVSLKEREMYLHELLGIFKISCLELVSDSQLNFTLDLCSGQWSGIHIQVQTYLEDIAGFIPDHRHKANLFFSFFFFLLVESLVFNL